MKTFETTTAIVPVMIPGTYWGAFEYDRLWRPDEDSLREDGYVVCNDYDFAKFKEAMVRAANKVLDGSGYLAKYGVVSVKVTDMGSPRYYNYGDDWFDLEFNVEDDFLDRAERAIFDPKYRDMLEDFARDEFRSHDGFISEMPAWSLEEMHDVFDMLRNDNCGRDDMRAFGSVVALLREIEKREGRMVREDDYEEGSLTWKLEVQIREDCSLSEFCTVMALEEAKTRFGCLRKILEDIDEQKRSIESQTEKYRASLVSDIAKDRANEIRDRILKELEQLEKDAVSEVEEGCPDAKSVEDGIAGVAERLDRRMEECWRQPPKGSAHDGR